MHGVDRGWRGQRLKDTEGRAGFIIGTFYCIKAKRLQLGGEERKTGRTEAENRKIETMYW